MSGCRALAIVSILTLFSVLMVSYANASLVPMDTTWQVYNSPVPTQNYAGDAKLVLQIISVHLGEYDSSDPESYFNVQVLYSGDPSIKEGSDHKLVIYQNGINFIPEGPIVPSQYEFKPGVIIGINDYTFDGATITVNIDATYSEAQAGDAWKQKITILDTASADSNTQTGEAVTGTSTSSTPGIFSLPSISAGNSLFNIFSTNPLMDNSKVQPSTTSGNKVALGQSQPFSLFSNTGLFNQPSGSNPGITQTQKDVAIKIASTSALCQEYNAYPDNSWDFQWANSNDNHDIILSKTIGSKGSTPYGYLDFSVDLNTGKITTANFTDLNVENNSTGMTPYQWQAGYTPKDFGFGFNY